MDLQSLDGLTPEEIERAEKRLETLLGITDATIGARKAKVARVMQWFASGASVESLQPDPMTVKDLLGAIQIIASELSRSGRLFRQEGLQLQKLVFEAFDVMKDDEDA